MKGLTDICCCCQNAIEANSVLMRCECLVTMCRECGLDQLARKPSTFRSHITCPICGDQRTNVHSGMLEGTKAADLFEKELLRSAFAYFKEPRPQSFTKNVVTRVLPKLNKLMERFEEMGYPSAPVMDGDAGMKTVNPLMLHLARCEALRQVLQERGTGEEQHPSPSEQLPLGPLEMIQLKQNYTLEKVLEIVAGADQVNRIVAVCYSCAEELGPGNTVLTLCSCYNYACQLCQRQAIANYKCTYQNAFARCIHCNLHCVPLGNAQAAKQLERDLLNQNPIYRGAGSRRNTAGELYCVYRNIAEVCGVLPAIHYFDFIEPRAAELGQGSNNLHTKPMCLLEMARLEAERVRRETLQLGKADGSETVLPLGPLTYLDIPRDLALEAFLAFLKGPRRDSPIVNDQVLEDPNSLYDEVRNVVRSADDPGGELPADVCKQIEKEIARDLQVRPSSNAGDSSAAGSTQRDWSLLLRRKHTPCPFDGCTVDPCCPVYLERHIRAHHTDPVQELAGPAQNAPRTRSSRRRDPVVDDLVAEEGQGVQEDFDEEELSRAMAASLQSYRTESQATSTVDRQKAVQSPLQLLSDEEVEALYGQQQKDGGSSSSSGPRARKDRIPEHSLLQDLSALTGELPAAAISAELPAEKEKEKQRRRKEKQQRGVTKTSVPLSDTADASSEPPSPVARPVPDKAGRKRVRIEVPDEEDLWGAEEEKQAGGAVAEDQGVEEVEEEVYWEPPASVRERLSSTRHRTSRAGKDGKDKEKEKRGEKETTRRAGPEVEVDEDAEEQFLRDMFSDIPTAAPQQASEREEPASSAPTASAAASAFGKHRIAKRKADFDELYSSDEEVPAASAVRTASARGEQRVKSAAASAVKTRPQGPSLSSAFVVPPKPVPAPSATIAAPSPVEPHPSPEKAGKTVAPMEAHMHALRRRREILREANEKCEREARENIRFLGMRRQPRSEGKSVRFAPHVDQYMFAQVDSSEEDVSYVVDGVSARFSQKDRDVSPPTMPLADELSAAHAAPPRPREVDFFSVVDRHRPQPPGPPVSGVPTVAPVPARPPQPQTPPPPPHTPPPPPARPPLSALRQAVLDRVLGKVPDMGAESPMPESSSETESESDDADRPAPPLPYVRPKMSLAPAASVDRGAERREDRDIGRDREYEKDSKSTSRVQESQYSYPRRANDDREEYVRESKARYSQEPYRSEREDRSRALPAKRYPQYGMPYMEDWKRFSGEVVRSPEVVWKGGEAYMNLATPNTRKYEFIYPDGHEYPDQFGKPLTNRVEFWLMYPEGVLKEQTEAVNCAEKGYKKVKIPIETTMSELVAVLKLVLLPRYGFRGKVAGWRNVSGVLLQCTGSFHKYCIQPGSTICLRDLCDPLPPSLGARKVSAGEMRRNAMFKPKRRLSNAEFAIRSVQDKLRKEAEARRLEAWMAKKQADEAEANQSENTSATERGAVLPTIQSAPMEVVEQPTQLLPPGTKTASSYSSFRSVSTSMEEGEISTTDEEAASSVAENGRDGANGGVCSACGEAPSLNGSAGRAASPTGSVGVGAVRADLGSLDLVGCVAADKTEVAPKLGPTDKVVGYAEQLQHSSVVVYPLLLTDVPREDDRDISEPPAVIILANDSATSLDLSYLELTPDNQTAVGEMEGDWDASSHVVGVDGTAKDAAMCVEQAADVHTAADDVTASASVGDVGATGEENPADATLRVAEDTTPVAPPSSSVSSAPNGTSAMHLEEKLEEEEEEEEEGWSLAAAAARLKRLAATKEGKGAHAAAIDEAAVSLPQDPKQVLDEDEEEEPEAWSLSAVAARLRKERSASIASPAAAAPATAPTASAAVHPLVPLSSSVPTSTASVPSISGKRTVESLLTDSSDGTAGPAALRHSAVEPASAPTKRSRFDDQAAAAEVPPRTQTVVEVSPPAANASAGPLAGQAQLPARTAPPGRSAPAPAPAPPVRGAQAAADGKPPAKKPRFGGSDVLMDIPSLHDEFPFERRLTSDALRDHQASMESGGKSVSSVPSVTAVPMRPRSPPRSIYGPAPPLPTTITPTQPPMPPRTAGLAPTGQVRVAPLEMVVSAPKETGKSRFGGSDINFHFDEVDEDSSDTDPEPNPTGKRRGGLRKAKLPLAERLTGSTNAIGISNKRPPIYFDSSVRFEVTIPLESSATSTPAPAGQSGMSRAPDGGSTSAGGMMAFDIRGRGVDTVSDREAGRDGERRRGEGRYDGGGDKWRGDPYRDEPREGDYRRESAARRDERDSGSDRPGRDRDRERDRGNRDCDYYGRVPQRDRERDRGRYEERPGRGWERERDRDNDSRQGRGRVSQRSPSPPPRARGDSSAGGWTPYGPPPQPAQQHQQQQYTVQGSGNNRSLHTDLCPQPPVAGSGDTSLLGTASRPGAQLSAEEEDLDRRMRERWAALQRSGVNLQPYL